MQPITIRIRRGQVFLALVFFIGGIVAIVGLMIAFFAVSAADTGYGAAAALNADSAATAGAEDALLRLDRNPAFPSGTNVTSTYAVVSGSSTATVSVTQNWPAAGEATVSSTATVLGHTKTIKVVVSENPTTEQINVISWTEVQ